MKSVLLFFLLLTSCSSKSVYEPEADRDGIRQVVARHLPETEKCYLKAIEVRPGAEGKVVLEWDLDKEGHAINTQITDIDPKIVDIKECLLTRLQSWRFPKPNSNEVVNIRYPLYFSENGNFRDTRVKTPPAESP